MKLKDGFLMQRVAGSMAAVTTGDAAKKFNGIVTSNSVGEFLLTLLQKNTTQQALVEAVLEKYDAPRAQVEADVNDFILTLREKGLLDD